MRLTLSNGSAYTLTGDTIHATDRAGRLYDRSADAWPWLLTQLAAWPDATDRDRAAIHDAAKAYAVGEDRANRVWINAYTIIGTATRIYAAWVVLAEPGHYARHSMISSLGTSAMYGQLGSEYASAYVESLPAMSDERLAASRQERSRRYHAAEAVILTSRHRATITRHPYSMDSGRIRVEVTEPALPF